MKRILQHQIANQCALHDIQSGGCYYITFKSDQSNGGDIIAALHALNENASIKLSSLLGKNEYPVYDKFDACLPQPMLAEAYAENRLDLRETQYRITTLSKEI